MTSVVVQPYTSDQPLPAIGKRYAYGLKGHSPRAWVIPLRVHTEETGWRLDSFDLEFAPRVPPDLKEDIRSIFERATGGMWCQMVTDKMLKLVA